MEMSKDTGIWMGRQPREDIPQAVRYRTLETSGAEEEDHRGNVLVEKYINTSEDTF